MSKSDKPTTPSVQSARSFKGTFTRAVAADYLLFLPRDYKKDSGKKWPLILFLHGSGERGADLERVKMHGPPMMVEKDPAFPFIVVSPQCPKDYWWNSDVLISLLDKIQKNYRVDPDRVYLTGLSMGAHAVWWMAIEYPDRFAAIAPISGGGYSDCANRLKHTPTWVFHGAKDKLVPPSEAQDLYAKVQKAGGDIKLTMYPDLGHNAWTRTYQNEELYKWFLEHTRRPLK